MKLLPVPDFHAPPTSAQFAKGGEWERAWILATDSLPSHTELESYLAGAREVAFEVFFGACFFGVRLTGDVEVVRHRAMDCLDLLRTSAEKGLLKALSDSLGLPLTDQCPAYLELGCVNAWRSVGATRFTCVDLAREDFDNVWHDVQCSAAGRDTIHPKAMEFAYEHPLPHWVAIPVSAQQPPHELSKAQLRLAFSLACSRDEGSEASVPHGAHETSRGSS